MEESYREGVTNHPGPEPCEGGRKTALEALDRGICRLGIELRNRTNRDVWVDNTPANTEINGFRGIHCTDRTLVTSRSNREFVLSFFLVALGASFRARADAAPEILA